MNNKNDKRWMILCAVFLVLFLGVWHLITANTDSLPGPVPVAKAAWFFLSDPFYDNGPNDQGIAILAYYSLKRLIIGFGSGTIVAVFLGVILGLNAMLFKAINPYIQILRAISPIAWMPILLYSVQDSGLTALLVIFMASLWPTLANTAFGVANIKKDYLNVANILQMKPGTKLLKVILPAAGPMIIAGLKISMGSAWVALVPAEALLGSLGLGYFIWNEWNNLSLSNVIFAVFIIGFVGVIIDLIFSRMANRLSFVD
ncbi:MAG: ABC transporter permease subunit [Pseudomonadota bacterium]